MARNKHFLKEMGKPNINYHAAVALKEAIARDCGIAPENVDIIPWSEVETFNDENDEDIKIFFNTIIKIIQGYNTPKLLAKELYNRITPKIVSDVKKFLLVLVNERLLINTNGHYEVNLDRLYEVYGQDYPNELKKVYKEAQQLAIAKN